MKCFVIVLSCLALVHGDGMAIFGPMGRPLESQARILGRFNLGGSIGGGRGVQQPGFQAPDFNQIAGQIGGGIEAFKQIAAGLKQKVDGMLAHKDQLMQAAMGAVVQRIEEALKNKDQLVAMIKSRLGDIVDQEQIEEYIETFKKEVEELKENRAEYMQKVVEKVKEAIKKGVELKEKFIDGTIGSIKQRVANLKEQFKNVDLSESIELVKSKMAEIVSGDDSKIDEVMDLLKEKMGSVMEGKEQMVKDMIIDIRDKLQRIFGNDGEKAAAMLNGLQEKFGSMMDMADKNFNLSMDKLGSKLDGLVEKEGKFEIGLMDKLGKMFGK